MMVRSIDSLTRTLRQLQPGTPGDDSAHAQEAPSTICIDIGDLFLAELRMRRERIKVLIRLVNEEADRSRGQGRSRKCRRRLQA